MSFLPFSSSLSLSIHVFLHIPTWISYKVSINYERVNISQNIIFKGENQCWIQWAKQPLLCQALHVWIGQRQLCWPSKPPTGCQPYNDVSITLPFYSFCFHPLKVKQKCHWRDPYQWKALEWGGFWRQGGAEAAQNSLDPKPYCHHGIALGPIAVSDPNWYTDNLVFWPHRGQGCSSGLTGL